MAHAGLVLDWLGEARLRRAGELLRQFQADPRDNLKQNREDGTVPPVNGQPHSQKEAAERAGMGEHQEKQAVRVSKVPEPPPDP